MRLRRLPWLLLLAGFPLACDFWFDGNPYREGAPSTGADGAVLPAEAATLDAPSLLDDAGAPDADAAGLGFCDASRALLAGDAQIAVCDDFDQPNRTTIQDHEPWSPGNIGAFVTDDPVSPPRAFRLSFNGGGPVSATTVPFTTTMTIDAKVRPAESYTGPYVLVVHVGPCYLGISNNNVAKACPGSQPFINGSGAFAAGAWTPVHLVLQRTQVANTLHVSLVVGSPPLANTTGGDLVPPDGGTLASSFTVELASGAGTAHGSIDFDDVLIKVE